MRAVCKSCLYKYFQTTADCPLCGVDLRPNPFERIRFDRTVQTIVNKIFSDLIEKDIAKEAHFYRSRGLTQEGACRWTHSTVRLVCVCVCAW
jgi:hypothetical protein